MTTMPPKFTADDLHRLLGLECTVRKYPDRDAWLAARTAELFDRTGSSELSALFGESPYDSVYSLWAKRTDPDAWIEAVEREADNLQWGKLIEGIILKRYAEQTGHKVYAWPQTNIVVASHFAGFCTPDGIGIDELGAFICECKGFNEADRKRWQDGPPLSVIVQAQHQMEVTGIHRCRVLALFGNQIGRLGVFEIEYDETFAAEIRKRAEAFARHVRDRIEPEIDESEMTAEAIYRLHPDDSGAECDLPEASDALAVELESIKADQKKLETRRTHIENTIKAAIGDATFGVTPGNRWFSWKTQSSNRIDSAKLRDEYPDLAEAVTTVSKCRVLRPMKSPPKVSR